MISYPQASQGKRLLSLIVVEVFLFSMVMPLRVSADPTTMLRPEGLRASDGGVKELRDALSGVETIAIETPAAQTFTSVSPVTQIAGGISTALPQFQPQTFTLPPVLSSISTPAVISHVVSRLTNIQANVQTGQFNFAGLINDFRARPETLDPTVLASNYIVAELLSTDVGKTPIGLTPTYQTQIATTVDPLKTRLIQAIQTPETAETDYDAALDVLKDFVKAVVLPELTPPDTALARTTVKGTPIEAAYDGGDRVVRAIDEISTVFAKQLGGQVTPLAFQQFIENASFSGGLPFAIGATIGAHTSGFSSNELHRVIEGLQVKLAAIPEVLPKTSIPETPSLRTPDVNVLASRLAEPLTKTSLFSSVEAFRKSVDPKFDLEGMLEFLTLDQLEELLIQTENKPEAHTVVSLIGDEANLVQQGRFFKQPVDDPNVRSVLGLVERAKAENVGITLSQSITDTLTQDGLDFILDQTQGFLFFHETSGTIPPKLTIPRDRIVTQMSQLSTQHNINGVVVSYFDHADRLALDINPQQLMQPNQTIQGQAGITPIEVKMQNPNAAAVTANGLKLALHGGDLQQLDDKAVQTYHAVLTEIPAADPAFSHVSVANAIQAFTTFRQL